MFKLDSTKCFITAIGCFVLFILFAIFEWFFLSMFTFLTVFGLLTFGIYKYRDERIRKEYAEFADMSMFIIGMSKEDVRKLNSKYIEHRIDMSNEAMSGICETCGGKVVDGVCTYCGNKYDDSTKITYLFYGTNFGQRTFTFKGDRLVNIHIWLNSLEQFL